MGFRVLIGGESYELVTYAVEEASSPLAASDSSGHVGTISLTLKQPNRDAPGVANTIRNYGPQLLIGKSVRLEDSRKGFTLGTVRNISENASALISVTCESRLGELNIYGVQVQPFVGTIDSAFNYYMSIAGINTDIYVDPAISGTLVAFPGWAGELWFNLKQLAAAIDAEISLVSGVILLRPIRTRIATVGRNTDRSLEVGGEKAQAVEIYWYDNKQITNQLVYPVGGWSDEVSVITANAGELVEVEEELSASLSSVQQPAAQLFVSPEHESSSVYAVSGDDGLPVDPQQFADAGGSVNIVINPDTTSITIQFQAPVQDIANSEGEPIASYSLALASSSGTGEYSTLRIIGTGVGFNKQLITIPTGLTAAETGTEVGVTIDNPFISSLNQAYRAGLRAANLYGGQVFTLSGTVTAINRLGDTGQATYPTYEFDETMHAGMTYGDVEDSYIGMSYQDVQDALFALVQNEFDNQVFGNAAGARVFDKPSRRWYRIRNATLNADVISYSADDDLNYGDVEDNFAGKTYGDVEDYYQSINATYSDANLMGLVEI